SRSSLGDRQRRLREAAPAKDPRRVRAAAGGWDRAEAEPDPPRSAAAAPRHALTALVFRLLGRFLRFVQQSTPTRRVTPDPVNKLAVDSGEVCALVTM